MKTLLSGLMAAALAASFAIPLPIQANAAPVFVPQQARSDVVKAESNRDWRYPRTSRRDRWERRADRWERRRWRERRVYRDRYYDDDSYYHRSYRAVRPHRYYRRHRPGVTLEFNF